MVVIPCWVSNGCSWLAPAQLEGWVPSDLTLILDDAGVPAN